MPSVAPLAINSSGSFLIKISTDLVISTAFLVAWDTQSPVVCLSAGPKPLSNSNKALNGRDT